MTNDELNRAWHEEIEGKCAHDIVFLGLADNKRHFKCKYCPRDLITWWDACTVEQVRKKYENIWGIIPDYTSDPAVLLTCVATHQISIEWDEFRLVFQSSNRTWLESANAGRGGMITNYYSHPNPIAAAMMAVLKQKEAAK